jgi:hypothetical protein
MALDWTHGAVATWPAAAWALLKVLEKAGIKISIGRNGNGAQHATFADNPQEYWDRMREVVTEPLSKVLENQTQALIRVLESVARLEGEARGRRE